MRRSFLAVIALSVGCALSVPGEAAQIRRPGLNKSGTRKGKAALERLHNMSPAERRRALEKLPPDRKRTVQQRLDEYDRLSEADRAKLAERFENFSELSPEKQESVRKMFRRMVTLPPERRQVLRRELNQLHRLPEDERRARIASQEFRESFNPSEREILEELSALSPGP